MENTDATSMSQSAEAFSEAAEATCYSTDSSYGYALDSKALDAKIAANFPGVVVRKDLVKAVKGNAIVPTYVLEYLLGQYAASDDEATILSGIDTVRNILAEHYVHRGEARLVQSKIREQGRFKVIDKVSVALNEKLNIYEAEFANLQIKRVPVEDAIVKNNEKLLVSGVWCLCELAYVYTGEGNETPWRLNTLKPIQLAALDLNNYNQVRSNFTTEEWIDLLVQSIGFNPQLFGVRTKLLHLVRLIPFVERNYNLVELGPKGTGKSHIYSEFSPHGMLISGGEVTVAKLFVNNSTGRIGLVGYWDAVAFDEFAGKKKRADRALVDILKNYMANKSFSRGIETLGAEASMVFVGNTAHTVPYMLKNSDLFDELPEQYHDPAFLDRIHFYIPGWEFEQIRNEMFSNGYGFVVDYLAEVLRHMRDADYSDKYQQYFELSSDITTRDRDGVHKTFSGLMKLIHPTGEASKKEIETLLQTAIEGRRRVKDQLIRIDSTMVPVKFEYRSLGGEWSSVATLEAAEFPELYGVSGTKSSLESGVESSSESNGESNTDSTSDGQSSAILSAGSATVEKLAAAGTAAEKSATAVSSSVDEMQELKTGHFKIPESRKGVSYDILFGPYIAGANIIELIDPYIRVAYQARNLMEFIETVAKAKDASQEVTVVLITKISDEGSDMVSKQAELLEDVQNGATLIGINLEIEYSETIHDRSIKTDTGWLISLGRGLDIFQQFDTSWFDPRLRQQRYRQVKEFEITYMRQAVKE